MGHRAGDVRDDERVAGVGLGLARVEVGDPAHRETGQIGDPAAHVSRHGEWQGADRRGLVDHDEHGPVLGLELGEHLVQFRFAVGQAFVERFLAGRSDGGGVVFALADVRTEVDVDVAGVDHVRPSVVPTRPSVGTDRHIHITKSLPASRRSRWSCP